MLGVESVPDGLAAGLLAGVNPVFGLYGYLMGTLAGAFATGSLFMSVQVTGAMAVTISDVPMTQNGERAGEAVATLAVMTGVVMLGLGLAGLGSLVRFIPASVLIGFVNAVAVNIVLGQLANFTGYASEGDNRVLRALDTLVHPGRLSLLSVLIGVLTVVLILGLERTRVGPLGLVLAIVLASGVAAFFPDEVGVLADLTAVPDSLPTPQLPALDLVPALVLPAVSLALIGLVQGAAVSGSVPNPDGRYPDASADFRGQGIANIVTGLLRGMPVGGSMSATSLVRSAGARSATANVVAAVTMAVAIVLSGQIMGYVAMPALAALLIVVGLRTFKVHDIMLVIRTGAIPATVMTTTFVLTLLLPLQYAVLAGVAIAVVLHVARQSNTVVVRRWTFDDAGAMPLEGDPPRTLAPQDEVIVTVYGSLFFAAAPVFLAQLPSVPTSCRGAVVILRLRGKEALGSTFIRAMASYATDLERAGGALWIAGASPAVVRQFEATGVIDLIGSDRVFEAESRVGVALDRARDASRRWRHRQE